jgi:hypothetical protein
MRPQLRDEIRINPRLFGHSHHLAKSSDFYPLPVGQFASLDTGSNGGFWHQHAGKDPPAIGGPLGDSGPAGGPHRILPGPLGTEGLCWSRRSVKMQRGKGRLSRSSLTASTGSSLFELRPLTTEPV